LPGDSFYPRATETLFPFPILLSHAGQAMTFLVGAMVFLWGSTSSFLFRSSCPTVLCAFFFTAAGGSDSPFFFSGSEEYLDQVFLFCGRPKLGTFSSHTTRSSFFFLTDLQPPFFNYCCCRGFQCIARFPLVGVTPFLLECDWLKVRGPFLARQVGYSKLFSAAFHPSSVFARAI